MTSFTDDLSELRLILCRKRFILSHHLSVFKFMLGVKFSSCELILEPRKTITLCQGFFLVCVLYVKQITLIFS